MFGLRNMHVVELWWLCWRRMRDLSVPSPMDDYQHDICSCDGARSISFPRRASSSGTH